MSGAEWKGVADHGSKLFRPPQVVRAYGFINSFPVVSLLVDFQPPSIQWLGCELMQLVMS